MASCFYCQYLDGHHAVQCPRSDQETKIRWRKGYDEGIKSKFDIPSSEDKVFQMGFSVGIVAQESRDNGFDPR